jgi:acyl-CoA synthetase (AMP-forming)/AMP-acid ligase II
MVISGGVNIYPAEIEAALHAVAGVHDCACSAFPTGIRRGADGGGGTAAGVTLDVADIRASSSLAGRLQGAKARRNPDKPAARGFRQDLQAAACAIPIGNARATDLELGEFCSRRPGQANGSGRWPAR